MTGIYSVVLGYTGPTGSGSSNPGPPGPQGPGANLPGPTGPTGSPYTATGATGVTGITGPIGIYYLTTNVPQLQYTLVDALGDILFSGTATQIVMPPVGWTVLNMSTYSGATWPSSTQDVMVNLPSLVDLVTFCDAAISHVENITPSSGYFVISASAPVASLSPTVLGLYQCTDTFYTPAIPLNTSNFSQSQWALVIYLSFCSTL